jgi:hypothetical protein
METSGLWERPSQAMNRVVLGATFPRSVASLDSFYWRHSHLNRVSTSEARETTSPRTRQGRAPSPRQPPQAAPDDCVPRQRG